MLRVIISGSNKIDIVHLASHLRPRKKGNRQSLRRPIPCGLWLSRLGAGTQLYRRDEEQSWPLLSLRLCRHSKLADQTPIFNTLHHLAAGIPTWFAGCILDGMHVSLERGAQDSGY
jgi:hypothetical protein